MTKQSVAVKESIGLAKRYDIVEIEFALRAFNKAMDMMYF